ncbi:hypothetical protein [Marinifilum fragile]|uniref:hypothetical protein n=1 Tax=Marinifilum fragile TaxID=570161 RepID=UPI0006CFF07A|nr:hypothetical protein [Marinifilum fragile]
MNTTETLLLDIKDSEKLDSFKRFKIKVAIIHSIIVFLYFVGVSSKERPSLFEIMGLSHFTTTIFLMCIVAISCLLIITVYRVTPSKGKILFTENAIEITSNKSKIEILIENIDLLNVYITKDYKGNKNYSIEFPISNKQVLFDLDLIFSREIYLFMNILELWKNKKVDVKVNGDEPKSIKPKDKTVNKQTHNPSNNYFSPQATSYSFGKPVKLKARIPYKSYNKTQVKQLVKKTLISLNWDCNSVGKDELYGYTDKAIRIFGDEYTVVFEARYMTIKINNVGGDLIPIGCKNTLSTFIAELSRNHDNNKCEDK